MTGLNKDTVRYRDEKGGDFHLELSTGRLFDLQGNQVSKWEPVESETTAKLSDYVAEQANLGLLQGLKGDPERYEATKNVLMSERLVKMDLGIGDVQTPVPMPNYAAGYRNAAPMADVVMPPLLVDAPAGKFVEFAKEDAFQRAMPIIGAPGAQVPEISPRIARANYSTTEYALGGYVSTQVEAAADAGLRIKQATARRIMTGLTLEREIRVANLMFASSTFDAGLRTTLASGFQWNGGASADPIGDLTNLIIGGWGEPTGILMSEKVWFSFIRTDKVQAFFRNKANSPVVPNPQQFSEMFGLPPIYIARMKYINTAGVLDYVWGNSVVVFRQPDQMPPNTQDDVATGYTFRWRLGAPDGATNNGWTVREYFVQDRGSMGGNKVVVVHHDAEVITSKYIGGLILAAYQLSDKELSAHGNQKQYDAAVHTGERARAAASALGAQRRRGQ